MASAPPLPSPPPDATRLQSFAFDPPDFMSMHRNYHADKRAQDKVFDAWECTAARQKYDLFLQALRIFPWSVDAWNGLGDMYRREYQQIENAITCYQRAEQCGNLIWPELREEEEIPWGVTDNRSYLRTYHGLAMCFLKKGDVDAAIEKLRFLLKVNPNDNQGCRYILFQALIDKGEFEEAEEVARRHADGRDSTGAYFQWGFVLIDFLTQNGQAHETLVQALQNNNIVPLLLLEELSLPPRPNTVSPGTIDEATDYVHAAKESWRRVPGALDWLKELQYRDGLKPDDDGSILFELLQKGRVVATLLGKGPMEVTTNVEKMIGTGLPDFSLPAGMKDHNPDKIVVYATGNEKGGLRRQSFTSFNYSSVEKVHFWSILRESETFGRETGERSCASCFGRATLKCGRCQIVWYCSPSCQRKDWSKGQPTPHKVMCKKLIKK